MVSGGARYKTHYRRLSEEADPLALVFRSELSHHAAGLFVEKLREHNGELPVGEFRRFARDLENGRVEHDFRYSQTSLYGIVVATLRAMGLVGRVKRRGILVYVPLEQLLPPKNPSPGTFYGLCWVVARKWNGLWDGESSYIKIVLRSDRI